MDFVAVAETARVHPVPMPSPRPHYPTKAAWAAAKAAELRAAADALALEQIPSSDWHRVRRKMDGIAHLRREAARFDAIAAAFALKRRTAPTAG